MDHILKYHGHEIGWSSTVGSILVWLLGHSMVVVAPAGILFGMYCQWRMIRLREIEVDGKVAQLEATLEALKGKVVRS